MSAAIQLKRQGYSPILFEEDNLGGVLKEANLVENYPGFPGGVSGHELAGLFTKQYESHSINTIYEKVIELDFNDGQFIAHTDNHSANANYAIIASGTKPKIPNEMKPFIDTNDRILVSVYPLLNIKDKTIVIVGSGDIAFDYALNLHGANDVTMLNRGEGIKCLELLQDRVDQSERIKYFKNTQIVNVITTDEKQLQINCNTGATIIADYILCAVGRKANIGFLSDNLIDRKTELEKDSRLYFIGDCKGTIFRQTAIAAGDAIETAMKIDIKMKAEKSR